jgi:tRNA pseudouridine13 synthase
MRYLTQVLGVGGRIRSKIEDFYVEEVLPFEPSGAGEHLLLLVEKRGVSTLEMIRKIARSLKMSRKRFGYGGLKDARAIARQYVSIWSLDKISIGDLPGVKIVEVNRHSRKLKPGTVKFNKFKIIIRDADEKNADKIMKILYEKGIPNYFGPQRFGSRRPNTHLVGERIVKNDIEGAVKTFVGNPYDTESPKLQKARGLFDKGELKESLEYFPSKFYPEKAVIQSLIQGADYLNAFKSINLRLRKLFVHAYQSFLFNQVLNERMSNLEAMDGDILSKGIPTGPLFGYKLKLAEKEAGKIERDILEKSGAQLEDFRCPLTPELSATGRRHKLFFKILDYKIKHNPLTLEFTLPKGCYATSVLREVMKNEAAI